MLAGEVRALLDSASNSIQQAVTSMRSAKEQLFEARQEIMLVRATSAEVLGIPTIDSMLHQLDEAMVRAPGVTDELSAYKLNL